jgi:hypothetical protein
VAKQSQGCFYEGSQDIGICNFYLAVLQLVSIKKFET